ncbi:MAG: hypothetical protein KAT25_03645 [Sulfuriflexus sp.]|nr:hypothetical protein [Sulfuriflexus sp.]
MFEIVKRREFTSSYDYAAFSVVRVHSTILKKLGGRNTWVKICGSDRCIYRLARGGRPAAGFNAGSIELDYDSCVELEVIGNAQKDENDFYSCSLTLEKSNFMGKFSAHWKHPNPAYRVPMQLSIIGFTLGIIGLALGIMGYA